MRLSALTHRLGDCARGCGLIRITIRFVPKKLTVLWILGLITAAWAQPSGGREEPSTFVQQQRAAQQQVNAVFDAQLTEAQRVAFDWGGWYSFNLFIFDDGVESSRTLRRHDLRLWARASLDGGTHRFYARVRTSLLDFNSGDSYDGNDDDVEGPNLERGTYTVDLMRALGSANSDLGLEMTAGRDLVVFGNGLSLATPLDHIALTATHAEVELRAVAGRTVGSSTDIDITRPIDESDRAFYGIEGVYLGWERHRPFGYVLWQRDQNSQSTFPIGQDFRYDSFYGGLGSHGELTGNLRYVVEVAYETGAGENYGFLSPSNEIEAYAANAELEYLFPGEHQPRASIEYLFGSGDSGRRFSPTDTIGGNRGDRLDSSFIGFGYQETGLSFAPLDSNLHMIRAGGAFYPCPGEGSLSRLELGTDWYLYHKHHRDGAVSDPTSDVRSGYLGWEMDYFANWRLTPDLAWTARLGAFFPGDAFSDRTTRTFFLVGMVWSF